jgi:Protein of unknown function (DUF1295)
MSWWTLLLLAWGMAAALQLALWLVQLRTRSATLVDAGWAASLVAIPLLYAALGGGQPEHRLLVAAMAVVAFGRLTVHILRRVQGEEDPRYRELRLRWRERGGEQSRFFVFFQALLPRVPAPHERLRAVGSEAFLGPRSALDEVGERGVELRVALHAVAVPAQNDPLRAEVALEGVADRVERGVVPARDDELRERRRGELLAGDVGLGGQAFSYERPRALLELGREGRGRMEVGADSDEQHVQERLPVVCRTVFPELFRAGRERVGGSVSGGDSRRGRLDDRERRESLRPARSCQ